MNKGCCGSLSSDHGPGCKRIGEILGRKVLLGLWRVLRFLSKGLAEGIRWVAAIKERDALDSEQNKGDLGWYYEDFH